MTKLSNWDKIPFVFSLGVLPALTIWIIIHPISNFAFDDMYLMTVIFLASLSTIGITFLSKVKEDHNPDVAKFRSAKNELKKLEKQLNNNENMIKDIEKQIKKKNETDDKKPEQDGEIKQEENVLYPVTRLRIELKNKSEEINTRIEKLKMEIGVIHFKVIDSVLIQNFEPNLKKKIEKELDKIKDGLKENNIPYAESAISKTDDASFESQIKILIDIVTNNSDAARLYEKKIGELNKKITKIKEKKFEEFGLDDVDNDVKKNSPQLFIFAALFAIIGGLAITAALDAFVDPDQNSTILYVHNIASITDLISSPSAFVIASYFPIAILFIHGAIIFLSSQGAQIISKGNSFGYFISSLILFMEGIILFYAATSINNFLNFSFWIFLLMAIDLAWLAINWAKGIDFESQWVHFNLAMLFFTLCILLLFHSVTQVDKAVYAFMLIIFVARTVADYVAGWKSVWGQFDISDSNAL
ncbi:MAG: hypothetical protein JHC41_09055 [Nitrosopumilus sp.]|nr:hypothetical protein [Nitrosopumilus sp.]